MLDSSRAWTLFGYDLKGAVHYVSAGWSDFLWGDNSPVLAALDEVVLARTEDGQERYFKAGKPCPAPLSDAPVATAIVVPERLALAKKLQLPLAVESNLDAVLALEVSASSPFPSQDTCSGWRISKRDDASLWIELVISSASAVMEYVARMTGSHNVGEHEVWSIVDDHVVVLGGFGEQARHQRNRSRLFRVASIAGYCAALLVCAAAIAAGAKYFELQKVKDMQANVEMAAEDALGMREGLSSARSMINAASGFLVEYPSPRRELNRLAAILKNDTWVSSFEMRGNNLRVEGQSQDASAVMELFLANPGYLKVEAPVAFKKLRSGEERFVLDLTLNTQESAE
jgi:hypothetical protein